MDMRTYRAAGQPKRGSWLGLAWLVNSKRGHRLGFDLAKNSPAWVGFDMILDHFNI